MTRDQIFAALKTAIARELGYNEDQECPKIGQLTEEDVVDPDWVESLDLINAMFYLGRKLQIDNLPGKFEAFWTSRPKSSDLPRWADIVSVIEASMSQDSLASPDVQ